ncbi:fibrobacter succinogenes major paralogous domain-containing protein, partial [Flavobacteriales bacterium]|nr:fibrobacter succinogenes major paralogous domain-containing protein [Flavobacteriales bacterium]
ACNYMGENECFYPLEGFDCDGNCFYDSDDDGEFESEVCCNSIGLEFWGNNDGGIYPTSQSLVQGLEADVEFVLNIPGTFEEPSTGTFYSVNQFIIEEVSGLPSWVEEIDLVGDTINGEEQICIPINGIPIATGEYEIQVSGIYTVLIFDLPFEIDAVEYSALLYVTENPNPVEGCTYDLAANYVAYATIDNGSCEFDGCAWSSALNYVPYGNGSEPCVYPNQFCGDPAALNYVSFGTGNTLQCLFEEQVCGAGLSWNENTNSCEMDDEFLQAIVVNICGEGTIWNSELSQCFPEGLCPEDLNSDGIIGITDLLQLLSTFGEYCEETIETSVFSCGDPMNYHGYDYTTVQIGEQCWFAENLRTELYQNGDSLLSALSSDDWSSASGPGYCAPYNETEVDQRGLIYNAYTARTNEVCPSGWTVLGDGPWRQFEEELGFTQYETLYQTWRCEPLGDWMKSNSFGEVSWDGTNQIGFSAIPAPVRTNSGQFWGNGNSACFWTSTGGYGNYGPYHRRLETQEARVFRDYNHVPMHSNNHGAAIRCVKD